MKIKRKNVIVMFTLVLLILASCENSSEHSNTMENNQPSDNNSTQMTDDYISNKDLTEHEKDTIEKTLEEEETIDYASITEDTLKEENTSNNKTKGSPKEEYLKKLSNTKRAAEDLQATDSSTYALKKIENDRWELWDDLLNEIYGVLKEQLSPEEMDALREKQRNWIKYRDDSALESSLKFKVGTQEHLEYVSVLANLTEERCYKLVEDYMK